MVGFGTEHIILRGPTGIANAVPGGPAVQHLALPGHPTGTPGVSIVPDSGKNGVSAFQSDGKSILQSVFQPTWHPDIGSPVPDFASAGLWFKVLPGFSGNAASVLEYRWNDDAVQLLQSHSANGTTRILQSGEGSVWLDSGVSAYNETPANAGDGEWHHVFVEVEHITLVFYYDGVIIKSASRPSSSFADSPNAAHHVLELFSGNALFSTGVPAGFLVDDVRVMSGALGATEVNNWYTAGRGYDLGDPIPDPPPPPPPPTPLPYRSYDGIDDVDLYELPNFASGSAEGKIEFHFRTTDTATNATIVSSADTASVSQYHMVRLNSGKITILSSHSASVHTTTTVNGGWNDGEWHHVVVEFLSGSTTVSVDGVNQSLTGTNPHRWMSGVTGRDNVTLGARIQSGGTLNFYEGDLHSVKIYADGNLLLDEIKQSNPLVFSNLARQVLHTL